MSDLTEALPTDVRRRWLVAYAGYTEAEADELV
jgi:hypothetical protein